MQPPEFGHEAQSPNLTAITGFDANLEHAPQSDGDVVAEPKRRRLHAPPFYCVPRQVHIIANHDVVAELEQVVVGQRETVDIHPASQASTRQSQVRRPDWRAAEERAREEAHDVSGRHAAGPLQ